MMQRSFLDLAKIHKVLIGFVLALFLASAYATNFVKIKLPKGVSIELPRNWIVFSKNRRITLDTMVESGLDLAGIEHQLNSDIPFAANYYTNGQTVGIINIRYYLDTELTQSAAQSATSQDVKELDAALRESIVKSTKAFGMAVLSWEGTKKTTINGITAFVTEYHRKSLKSTKEFRVRLVRVFAGKRTFTLTVSYREDESFFLKTITDRIISSLKLTGIKKASATTSQISSNATNFDLISGMLDSLLLLGFGALIGWVVSNGLCRIQNNFGRWFAYTISFVCFGIALMFFTRLLLEFLNMDADKWTRIIGSGISAGYLGMHIWWAKRTRKKWKLSKKVDNQRTI